MRIAVPSLIYGLVYVILLGWVTVVSIGLKSSPFFLASLLGLGAFVIMWAHYFNGFLRDNFFPKSDTKTLYKITKYVVSFCIVFHPILISYYLISKGYGLPPFNYSNFFGAGKSVFVYLGLISLAIFIVFDFKDKLSKKNQTIVEHLSNLAMVLIVVHGLVLGYVLKSDTNQIIFYILGVTLFLMLGRIYMKEKNKTISIIGVTLLVLSMLVVTFIVFRKGDTSEPSSSQASQIVQSTTTNNSDDTAKSTNSDKISISTLSAKNGKNGNECWVAVDGQIYNLSKSKKWKNGEHTEAPSQGIECGKDLSDQIGQSPHGKSALNDYPIVGAL